MATNPNSDESAACDRARRFNEIGLRRMSSGHIAKAIAAFDRSLALFATVEGYTNRGQAYSRLDHFGRAIADCRRAIRLDGRHGRPYNDIGVYLIAKGCCQEAVPWLERAKKAVRYPSRRDAYLNLGRLYLMLDEQEKALAEFVGVLELDPDNGESKAAIAALDMTF